MTKSHGHQQIALFNGLVKRAQSGARGLSKGSMVLAYDFDSEDQLNHALDALVQSHRIAIDLDGRFPAIRLYRSKYHSLQPLKRPLMLSPGLPGSGVSPASAAPAPSPTPVQTRPAPVPASKLAAQAPREPVKPATMPPHKFQEPDRPISGAVASALALEAEQPTDTVPLYAQFRISREDAEWLLEEINRTEESIAFPALCKQLFQAELDRRRSPEGMKHKLTADVIRAAREEKRDLGEFVTAMIAVGMQARAMNRRGV